MITERLAASFRAIFAPHLAQVTDGAAPLGIHWCLSPAIAGMAELGPDGHPAKNLSLPPVPQGRCASNSAHARQRIRFAASTSMYACAIGNWTPWFWPIGRSKMARSEA